MSLSSIASEPMIRSHLTTDDFGCSYSEAMTRDVKHTPKVDLKGRYSESNSVCLIEELLTERQSSSSQDISGLSPFVGSVAGQYVRRAATIRILGNGEIRRAGAGALPNAWVDFLDDLAARTGIGKQHASLVHATWESLKAAIGPSLPLPMAEDGDDGSFKFSWSRSTFYAEIEIYPDRTYAWFFRDRLGNRHFGSEGPECGGPSRKFLALVGAAVSR